MRKQPKSTAPTKKYVVCTTQSDAVTLDAVTPEDAFEKAANEWGVEVEELITESDVFVYEIASSYEVLPKPKKPEPV